MSLDIEKQMEWIEELIEDDNYHEIIPFVGSLVVKAYKQGFEDSSRIMREEMKKFTQGFAYKGAE